MPMFIDQHRFSAEDLKITYLVRIEVVTSWHLDILEKMFMSFRRYRRTEGVGRILKYSISCV